MHKFSSYRNLLQFLVKFDFSCIQFHYSCIMCFSLAWSGPIWFVIFLHVIMTANINNITAVIQMKLKTSVFRILKNCDFMN